MDYDLAEEIHFLSKNNFYRRERQTRKMAEEYQDVCDRKDSLHIELK